MVLFFVYRLDVPAILSRWNVLILRLRLNCLRIDLL